MGYLQFVNGLQGTASNARFSHGNTLAMVQMPFGMGGYTLQTSHTRGNWFFHPDDTSVEGIRLTHQPSPWIGDYGCFCFLPEAGEPYAGDCAWSSYRPQEAIVRPDLLDLFLLRYGIRLKLTPTERGAVVCLCYPEHLPPRFALFPALPGKGETVFRVADTHTVLGETDTQPWQTAVGFRMHIAFRFDCAIDQEGCRIAGGDGVFTPGTATTDGSLNLALTEHTVTVRIASSYISAEQALCNLERETGFPDFDSAHRAAADAWERKLATVSVQADTPDEMRTFYSCLSRVFLYPHKAYEIAPSGDTVHYSPHDGTVKPGKIYTNNGFWDTYRTVYPLLSVISPTDCTEAVEGFLNLYHDSGWLPRWPAIGEFGCMPGTLIDAVIADAAVKGLLSAEALEDAFKGMCRHATEAPEDRRYGRIGVTEYNRYGYVPDHIPESVNNTLDSCYGDFCIAQVALLLGKKDLFRFYLERSKGYRRLFDPAYGLMRPLDSSGGRSADFDPFAWGGAYTEGSAYQSSFSVPHDPEGLADLYGGKAGLLAELDEVFSLPPRFSVGGYRCEIHEMSEMAAVDLGQCAISNQPCFHYPYLYAYFGEQEKTDRLIHRIARLFSARPQGFPGDEDNGSMAAWYVLSALGFYPLCPGKAEYVRGTPLVHEILVRGVPLRTDTLGPVIPHAHLLRGLS